MKYIRFNKNLIIVLCVLLIAVFTLPFVFILENAGHDCVGEGCQTCLRIGNAQSAIKRFGMGLPAVAAPFSAVLLICTVFAVTGKGLTGLSPVSLKVKLNN